MNYHDKNEADEVEIMLNRINRVFISIEQHDVGL